MIVKGTVEEKVKSIKITINDVKDYLVLKFRIESSRPYLFFFFLVDPDGVLRAQFEGKKREEEIFFGRETGSIGTYPGEIKNGEWTLYFTNYGLVESEEDKEVTFSLKMYTVENVNFKDFTLIGDDKWVDWPPDKKGLTLHFDPDKKKSTESRWYRGDFHTHTTLSDCHMTPKEAVEYCETNGIDFMFLTEHNLIHTGFEESSTLFIPAVEVTLLKGHLLVYGLRDFINCFSYEKFEDGYMSDAIDMVKKNGGLINVAHPMMVPWDWRFMETQLKEVDMIEIVNCPNWHTSEEDNKKAIQLLDILWNEGFKITGVGGSDNHLKPDENYNGYIGPSLYSDPATYVFSEGLSERAVFEAVKKGRVYVSRGIELNINIYSNIKKYYPGDEIKEDKFTYNVNIIKNQKGNSDLNLFLIINGKLIEKKGIKGIGTVNFNISWEEKAYNWARVGIESKNGKFVSYINPVYRGKKKSNLLIWKDLVDYYEKKIRDFS